MTHIESSPEVWDFEAGYLPELPLKKEVDPNSQKPNNSTTAPTTDLFTPPDWPHSY